MGQTYFQYEALPRYSPIGACASQGSESGFEDAANQCPALPWLLSVAWPGPRTSSVDKRRCQERRQNLVCSASGAWLVKTQRTHIHVHVWMARNTGSSTLPRAGTLLNTKTMCQPWLCHSMGHICLYCCVARRLTPCRAICLCSLLSHLVSCLPLSGNSVLRLVQSSCAPTTTTVGKQAPPASHSAAHVGSWQPITQTQGLQMKSVLEPEKPRARQGRPHWAAQKICNISVAFLGPRNLAVSWFA